MNIIEFERQLFEMRMARYRHPEIDIIKEGFRPVSGKVADFAVAERDGVYHFYYIERRLTEGTPFYPGNEIYFGHASTANFFDWEVHDPVLLIRPGTWESAHVWAPCIVPDGKRWVMAYTGLNDRISQDIGLAFSEDLFNWTRWEGNPISPCKDRAWAHWREDSISSCRDPHVLRHEGRVWMAYTANTVEGASCIALASSPDLEHWEDHGPILVGPADGYEPRLQGGHPQGSLESCCLLTRNGKWYLLVKSKFRHSDIHNWIFEGKDITGPYDMPSGREFWAGALGIEVIKDKGSRSLLACFVGGTIRFGQVDWSQEQPTAAFVSSAEELKAWQ